MLDTFASGVVVGEKAPAFQFYAADWLADRHTRTMSLSERGLYIDLLAYCWREGSIPDDLGEVSDLAGRICDDEWPRVRARFHPHPDTPGELIHTRLERQRSEAEAYREAKRRAGKKGAQVRWGKGVNGTAKILPLANDSPSSSSSKEDEEGAGSREPAAPSSERVNGDPARAAEVGEKFLAELAQRKAKKKGGASRPREANDR